MSQTDELWNPDFVDHRGPLDQLDELRRLLKLREGQGDWPLIARLEDAIAAWKKERAERDSVPTLVLLRQRTNELGGLRAAVEKSQEGLRGLLPQCSEDKAAVIHGVLDALDAALRMQDIQKSSDAEAEIICVNPKDKVKIDAALRAKP